MYTFWMINNDENNVIQDLNWIVYITQMMLGREITVTWVTGKRLPMSHQVKQSTFPWEWCITSMT